jgi:hypothetical protein
MTEDRVRYGLMDATGHGIRVPAMTEVMDHRFRIESHGSRHCSLALCWRVSVGDCVASYDPTRRVIVPESRFILTPTNSLATVRTVVIADRKVLMLPSQHTGVCRTGLGRDVEGLEPASPY